MTADFACLITETKKEAAPHFSKKKKMNWFFQNLEMLNTNSVSLRNKEKKKFLDKGKLRVSATNTPTLKNE